MQQLLREYDRRVGVDCIWPACPEVYQQACVCTATDRSKCHPASRKARKGEAFSGRKTRPSFSIWQVYVQRTALRSTHQYARSQLMKHHPLQSFFLLSFFRSKKRGGVFDIDVIAWTSIRPGIQASKKAFVATRKSSAQTWSARNLSTSSPTLLVLAARWWYYCSVFILTVANL